MALIAVNGIELAVEESGAGDPLVLVHGSWGDRTGWGFVEGDLAQTHHVVSYDRRGHTASPPAAGTRRDDEDDLAALIEHLGPAPAHVVGNSFGASITLGLAARRPDLVRSVCVHEPPLMGVCPDDPLVQASNRAVGEGVLPRIHGGDAEAAAQTFVNDVALGPGAWDLLPPEEQARMAGNAATFLEEMQDPDWSTVDLAALAECPAPMLLTYGDQSPPFFARIVETLRSAVPRLAVTRLPGAGHLPHLTNVPDWLAVVRKHVAAT